MTDGDRKVTSERSSKEFLRAMQNNAVKMSKHERFTEKISLFSESLFDVYRTERDQNDR